MSFQTKTLLRALALCFLFSPALMAAQGPLKDISSGEPRSLEELKVNGKWTIVMIWASDCHVCNREMHSYVDFHFFHSDKDARVVGISVDGWAGKKDADAFIKRHKVNFPNLIGNVDAVGDWFSQQTGARWVGTPTFVIYGPGGDIRAQQAGAVPVELIEDFISSGGDQANTGG